MTRFLEASLAVVLGCACGRSRAAPTPTVEAAPVPAASAAAYPVRWSPQLGLASLAEVGARLAAEGKDVFGELASGEHRVLPTSCRHWASLHASGYAPSTTLEAQPDAGATLRCETLALLAQARPARTSFVRDLSVDGAALVSRLPALLATAESRERAERRGALATAGKSLADLDPRASVSELRADGLIVQEGDGQSSIQVQAQAWGDFDGDGIDDVALGVVNAMTQGSLTSTRLIVATRGASGEALRVLSSSDNPTSR